MSKKNSNQCSRILLHGNCFDGNACNGVTTNGLFGGWPKEKLAAIGGIDHFPRDSVINQYYCLGEEEDKWVFPLSLLPMPGRQKSGPRYPETIPELQQIGNNTDYIQATSGVVGKVKKSWKWVMDCLDSDELLRKRRLSTKLHRWVDNFHPDIIYTILGSLNNIRFADTLTDVTGASLVIHIMDDWPATAHLKGFFAPYLRKKMLREILAILKRASVRLAISQAMCDEYEKRYGFDFQPFHNPIDLSAWKNVSRNKCTAGKPFRFVYTGRIGVANAESLRDMVLAIKSLHGRGYDICLEIYSSDFHNPDFLNLVEKNVIDILPPVSHDQIPALLSGADGLILPLDFDEEAKKYARFSIPTKASEYMASGTPILLFAPPEMAVSKYAEDKDWAILVAERDMNKLQSAIIQICQDESFRRTIGQQARKIAFINHNKRDIQEKFYEALTCGGR